MKLIYSQLVGWAKAHRRVGLLAQAAVVRLCPPCPTLPLDRVGKVATGQRDMASAAAGDFVHPTSFHLIGR
jgi:hypothetical protein